MTRCKYCRCELAWRERNAGRAGCFGVDDCRDRMLDRERRVVRVFWRVYFDVPESRRNDCECGASYCLRCCPRSVDYPSRRESRWGTEWAQTKAVPTRLVRVTVRRKVKA